MKDLCFIGAIRMSDFVQINISGDINTNISIKLMQMRNQQKQLCLGFFLQWFPQMQRDFCEDDHDQEVSVTSLSVQIFTVPSLVGLQTLIVDPGGLWVGPAQHVRNAYRDDY